MNEFNTMMNDKRDFLLKEMGLGAVWKLRHDAPLPEPSELASVSESEQLKMPPSELNTQQDEGATAAFALFLNEPDDHDTAGATEPEIKLEPENSESVTVNAAVLVDTYADKQLDAATDFSWSVTAPFSDALVSVDTKVLNTAGKESAPCICGLSDKPEQTLFRADRARPEYLFVYCDAAAGARRHHAADKAKALFENMLMAMDVQRGTKSYLSNVLLSVAEPSRDKNVTALAAEYSVCLPCLRRQVKLMQPSLIVALGNTVAAALMKVEPVALIGLRGYLQHFEGLPLVLSDDPRYLLTHPLEKAKVWSDLCLAMKSLASHSV